MEIGPGEIFFVNIPATQVVGSEQHTRRPFVVVSRLSVNRSGRVVVAVPLTTAKTDKPQPPYRILIPPSEIIRDVGYLGTPMLSIALTDQVRVLDKSRLETKMGVLSGTALAAVGLGLSYLLDL